MRKAVVAFVVVALLPAYLVLAVTAAERLGADAWWSQLIFFAVAGIVWALPLRPLMRWAHRAGVTNPPRSD